MDMGDKIYSATKDLHSSLQWERVVLVARKSCFNKSLTKAKLAHPVLLRFRFATLVLGKKRFLFTKF